MIFELTEKADSRREAPLRLGEGPEAAHPEAHSRTAASEPPRAARAKAEPLRHYSDTSKPSRSSCGVKRHARRGDESVATTPDSPSSTRRCVQSSAIGTLTLSVSRLGSAGRALGREGATKVAPVLPVGKLRLKSSVPLSRACTGLNHRADLNRCTGRLKSAVGRFQSAHRPVCRVGPAI